MGMKHTDPIESLKKKLLKRPKDDLTVRMIDTLQKIANSTHPNQLQAVQCLEGSVVCFDRGDLNASRLLYWVSGALLDAAICHATWTAVASAAQDTHVPRAD